VACKVLLDRDTALVAQQDHSRQRADQAELISSAGSEGGRQGTAAVLALPATLMARLDEVSAGCCT